MKLHVWTHLQHYTVSFVQNFHLPLLIFYQNVNSKRNCHIRIYSIEVFLIILTKIINYKYGRYNFFNKIILGLNFKI